MRLIHRVRVRAFRSIHDATVAKAGHLSVLVGKNSSGKSNLLRALNLFFTGEPQPGQGLAFQRDLHEIPRRREKKRISIEVDFELPASFKIRAELAALRAAGRQLTVIRHWELDRQRRIQSRFEVLAGGEAVASSEDAARQLLQLISYRYVPNRSIPAELLRDESQSIADMIFLRMRGGDRAKEVLANLQASASRMLEESSTAMTDSGSPLTNPTVSTAETLGEMLRMSGFQALGPHGKAVQDEDWGAGHQSFFLFHVLRTLDTAYDRFFGWRQATIWGVEEPESGLHRDLETRLGQHFRDWASEDRLKLQILTTTHSPVFTMAADAGYWVQIEGQQTIIGSMPIDRLVRAAEAEGVSPWIHPVLSFIWSPVVLVEGSIDQAVLSHVSQLAGFTRFRFASLTDFDQSEKHSSKDHIINYVRNNRALIERRQRDAPLLVLLDWDTSDQDLQRARKAYGVNGRECVLRMNANHCQPELGTDFRGIERFYPESIVREASAEGEVAVAQVPGRALSISSDELRRSKKALMGRMLAATAPEDLRPLVSVLTDLEAAAKSLLSPQRALFGVDERS